MSFCMGFCTCFCIFFACVFAPCNWSLIDLMDWASTRVLVNCWKVGRQKMRVKSNIYDACWGNSWVDIQAACAIICSKPGPKTAAKIICFKILHTFCRHHFTCFHKKFAIRSVINQQSKFIIYLLFDEILYFGVNFRGYSKLSVSLH